MGSYIPIILAPLTNRGREGESRSPSSNEKQGPVRSHDGTWNNKKGKDRKGQSDDMVENSVGGGRS